ncbi:hypothetical protein FPRO05_01513 [Fusarium proliferatum]|uniref:Uncharacterized protein n=1 Tax=Gibberella intermedia TaxID=948311 RepID=A0A365N7K3_GIBIN|nr:hypothetical protein FPRO05_01513 [Fusarium proliferatum]
MLPKMVPRLSLHHSNPVRRPKAEVPVAKKKRSRLFCSYCKKANHTAETCRLVPNTIIILSLEGQLAPNGCTFRVATGRVEKKKNKKNNKKKKKADEKLADKVSKEVEAM